MVRALSKKIALVLAGFLAIAVAYSDVPVVRDGASGYTVVCAVADQPNVRSCAQLPQAQACTREPESASRPSKDATGMVFANRSNSTVKIYWLDFQGHRRLYRSLSPGDKTTQNTFIGHNWLIANLRDECIGIFKAAPESLAFF
jgi:hypothetical protein